MIPDNVTLIVKAPNQQIEDQNIECQSSWTVRQLKGHLSEVYPSKPKTDEQKIIYSGQLLEDNTILKDILRTYEYQIGHTMHLVCTPKRNEYIPRPVPKEPQNDGLRQRNVENSAPEQVPRQETQQNDQNHTVEMQNYLSSFANNYRVPPYPANYNMGQYLPMGNDPASINQMMMMQQAYMQYMQQYGQYAQMWQAGANAVPPTNVPQPNAAPAQPAAPAEDPEEVARDWLDHLYAGSRLAVLFSLVYLYSSPFRLLFVVMLLAAGYLYQIGFFRELAVNQNQAGNQNENQQPNAQRNEQPVPNENIEPVVNQNDNRNVNQNDNRNFNQNDNQNVNQRRQEPVINNIMDNENQQSLLAVTWMIVASFFTSLIPETNQ